MDNFLSNLFIRQPEQPEVLTEPKKLIVNQRRCPQNHPCPSVTVCPYGALSQKGFAAPTVDMEKCVACGKCVKFCPMRALSLAQ